MNLLKKQVRPKRALARFDCETNELGTYIINQLWKKRKSSVIFEVVNTNVDVKVNVVESNLHKIKNINYEFQGIIPGTSTL